MRKLPKSDKLDNKDNKVVTLFIVLYPMDSMNVFAFSVNAEPEKILQTIESRLTQNFGFLKIDSDNNLNYIPNKVFHESVISVIRPDQVDELIDKVEQAGRILIFSNALHADDTLKSAND